MSDQPQNIQGGQPAVVPEDPEYELQQHIQFKRKQQILNFTFKNLIQSNLSQLQLIMDGTNHAFTNLTLENKGLQQVTDVICAYSHLRKINLGFNQLKQIGFLQKLKFIIQINLQRNLLEQAKFLQNSQSFIYMKKLNLQGNKIQALPTIQLQNLIHLNLNSNIIKTLQDFEGHPKIRILQLRKNKITKLKGLGNMPELRQLYLAQNQIQDLSLIKNLPKLIKLNARKNKIQKIEQLIETPTLKYLNLRQNLVKGIDNLKGICKSVQILNLLACPISEQMGDNTKKQIWMRFRNYQRINKSQIGAQEKQQFDKQYKQRLAQQERQRLEKEAAQKQARQAAQKQGKQQ